MRASLIVGAATAVVIGAGIYLPAAWSAARTLPTTGAEFAEWACKAGKAAPKGTHTYAMAVDYILTEQPVHRAEIIMNVDGTWTGDPWRLLGTMAVAAYRDVAFRNPAQLGWRLVLAWPLLPHADGARSEYIATHPETWSCS